MIPRRRVTSTSLPEDKDNVRLESCDQRKARFVLIGLEATVRQHVRLDEFVIMPNHLHGILMINEGPGKTSHRDVSTKSRLLPQSLGAVIGQFKSVCTKRIRGAGFSQFSWQRVFYEHIIRDERSLGNIRQYIVDNPAKWDLDTDNPNNFDQTKKTFHRNVSTMRG